MSESDKVDDGAGPAHESVHVPPEMVQRLTAFTKCLALCIRELKALDPVSRGRIVADLARMFKEDVRLYHERSTAAVAALLRDDDEPGPDDPTKETP